MASLSTYRKKRNFKITPEPSSSNLRSRGKHPIFVIQKHEATRLHYDFRLEMDGVLKSWAVPKGLSTDTKRLAVQTEDHPLAYANFEGVIPEHQYGAGNVEIWDRGIWIPDGSPEKALKSGNLKFSLEGKKVHGHFHLVRTRTEAKQPQWLLIPGHSAQIDETPSERKTQLPQKIKSREKKPLKRTRVDLQNLFEKASPQLASLVTEPPRGDRWISEIKYDGYRLLSLIDGKKVTIKTRNQNDWTDKFPRLIEPLKRLKLKNAILDGEVVALDSDQKTSFQKLQNYFDNPQSAKIPIAYYIFDLLYLNGEDLRALPLEERQNRLQKILKNNRKGSPIRLSEILPGGPEKIQAAACKLKLEGVMCKDRDSPYEFRRTKTWLKLKCQNNEEFSIIGYTDPKGGRNGFGALLLGEKVGSDLVYRGKVGTGFTTKSLSQLYERMKTFARDEKPDGLRNFSISSKNVHWIEPELYAQIHFTEVTSDGHLRHPAFVGLREDKSPEPVSRSSKSKRNSDSSPLSHPEKILFPEDKITKKDLLQYYQKVSKKILPEILNRPLMLKRCPDGYSKFCFFQKHASHELPEGIKTVKIREKEGEVAEYIYVSSAKGLDGLAQLAAIELHVWGSKAPDIEHPDRFTLDFDPSPGWKWKDFLKQIKFAYQICQKLGLKGEPRVSGGKGVHIVFPVKNLNWEECKNLSRQISAEIEKANPDIFLIKASKQARKGKIFIDWLRNGRGATAVAAYSPRARKGAPLAMPLTWAQLYKTKSSQDFHLKDFI